MKEAEHKWPERKKAREVRLCVCDFCQIIIFLVP